MPTVFVERGEQTMNASDALALRPRDAILGAPSGADVVDARARWRPAPADLVWAAFMVLSFVFLAVVGSRYWFAGDEWQFLVNPKSAADVLVPQNGHWSTTPIVVYQAIYAVFGLHSYVPYQAVLILLHLTLATLVRLVMRRSGVGPWIATAVAASFVLYAPGDQNIFQGVQIGMVGTMVGAFGHMVLADRNGRFSRLDAVGVLVGALGLMSSGMGPALVATTGLAILIRRGFLVAVLHIAPLGLLYVAWYVSFSDRAGLGSFGNPPANELLRWVTSGQSGVFLGLGLLPIVAVALAVALVVGLVFAWRRPLAELRVVAAIPFACLVGSLSLFAMIAIPRWIVGAELARSSRYVAMATALTLPALGVAFDALGRRVRHSAWALCALLLVAVPHNVTTLGMSDLPDAFYVGQRELVVAVAGSPLSAQVPADSHFDGSILGLKRVPTGFLVDAAERGLVPDGVEVSVETTRMLPVRLGIQQTDGRNGTASCPEIGTSYKGPLAVGDALVITAPVRISDVDGGQPGLPMTYDPAGGAQLDVVLDGRTWRVVSDRPIRRCSPG